MAEIKSDEELTVAASVVGFPSEDIGPGITRCVFQVQDAPLRFRFTADPDADSGYRGEIGQVFELESAEISKVRFIREGSTNSKIYATFYS